MRGFWGVCFSLFLLSCASPKVESVAVVAPAPEVKPQVVPCAEKNRENKVFQFVLQRSPFIMCEEFDHSTKYQFKNGDLVIFDSSTISPGVEAKLAAPVQEKVAYELLKSILESSSKNCKLSLAKPREVLKQSRKIKIKKFTCDESSMASLTTDRHGKTTMLRSWWIH